VCYSVIVKHEKYHSYTLDDETYRKARIRAAELDTSVSAVVRKYLTEFAAGESRFERLKKQEEAVRARI
jgi:plasmid stability protein